MSSWDLIGTYLVHGWMHLFMVHVDYKFFGIGWLHGWCTCLWYRLIIGWGTGWCMVDALVYGTCWLHVGAWLMYFFVVWFNYRLRYRLMHGWCMVQIYWYMFTVVYLTVIVWQWFHHSTSTSGWQDRARTGGCSRKTLGVVASFWL